MSYLHSFRCTCGNKAKNLMTMTTGELIAKCNRCAPIRPGMPLRYGVATIVTLDSVALTDQLASKISNDTMQIIEEKSREREHKAICRSKAERLSSTYALLKTEEKEISNQVPDSPPLPTTFTSRNHKWNYISYTALALIFEFHGEWGINRVSKRWYDCFTRFNFKLEIPTLKFASIISKCCESINITTPGWSEEHATFWKRLTACHTETISLLTILPNLPTPRYSTPRWFKLQLTEWVLHEIIRPAFMIHDKILMDHISQCFDDTDWIFEIMKTEFRRIAHVFINIRRFPLFLQEYGYLMEHFGTSAKMLNEVGKLPEDKSEED